MIVHRFVRYLDTPGGDPTGFNDQVLGLLGDILQNQYPVVAIPNTVFHLVGAAPVRVPTLAAMNALLPTWANPEVALGPFTKQDAETEVVRPRHLQLIPARLAAILIHCRCVNAKTAYQELFGAIQAEGDMEAYVMSSRGCVRRAQHEVAAASRTRYRVWYTRLLLLSCPPKCTAM